MGLPNVLLSINTDPCCSNFEKRPPKRDYPDYYKLIERPTSIFDVKALVRQGKVTDWDALAKEVRLIWDNAKEYNEPGSEIYDLTEALEVWCAAVRCKWRLTKCSHGPRTNFKLLVRVLVPKLHDYPSVSQSGLS